MHVSHWYRQPRFYGLVLLAMVFGGVIGALTALFWVVLYAGITFLWETLPASTGIDPYGGWYVIPVVVGGSILVGMCQRYLGDHPKDMKTEIQAFREHGRFDTAHIPQGLLTSLVSLVAGASLGPEAPLFGLGGGLSSLAADRLRQISIKADDALWTKTTRRVLLAASLISGTFTFAQVAVGGGVLGSGGIFIADLYQFAWEHLPWAITGSLIGTAAGYLFLASFGAMQRWITPLRATPVRRAVLGGVIFAAAAAVFPLTLFSGQHSLHALQLHGQEMAGITVLVSGLLKIFSVGLLLNTGWKGGTFLPLMTGAAMLGLVLSILNPSVPTLVPMVAAMTAVAAITLNNPAIVLVMMLVLAPVATAPVYVCALLVGMGIMRLVQRGTAQAQPAARMINAEP